VVLLLFQWMTGSLLLKSIVRRTKLPNEAGSIALCCVAAFAAPPNTCPFPR
jgi:hypothetical protein